jgi:predicted Zn finger-like uncharacterized protein
MIAACPKCAARYRIERERLHAGSVRLRCARCEAVFRVRPPEMPEAAPAPEPARETLVEPKRAAPQPVATAEPPPAPAPAPVARGAGELVLVAMPDAEIARRTGELLAQRGLRVLFASDGVEAMLEIQRKLPRAIVLAADLPKMYGFQICEVVKRNESLRGIWVVLVGAIHHPERYRRAPGDLYGADAYVEGPELPAGLLPLLAQGGVSVGDAAVPPAKPAASPPPPAARAPLAPAPEAPVQAPAPATPPSRPPPAAAARTEPARVAPAARPAPRDGARVAPAARPPEPAPAAEAVVRPAAATKPRSDGLDDERGKAERLARIVVSDIVLYNEERFLAAVRAGNVLDAMAADLAEGRQLFEERIDARVRAERDHLKDELLRRAQGRGMR